MVAAACAQIQDVPDANCPEKKSCGPQKKCGPAEKPHTPGDDVDKLVKFMQDQLKDAIKKLDPNKLEDRGTIAKLKQALGYWAQIKAASCVPDEVMQAISGYLAGVVECDILCAKTKTWYEKMIGAPDSIQGKMFYESCLAHCVDRH